MDDNNPIGISVVSEIYNKKLQQEKLKQEEQKLLVQKATAARHQRMLEALVEARNALKEISSVDLGEQFSFDLFCDDSWGWPRLNLRIISSLVLKQEPPSLIISANDRAENGNIEFSFIKQRILSLQNKNSSAQVSTFLRQCLREFLDTATEFVLDVDSHIEYNVEEDSIEKQNILPSNENGQDFSNEKYHDSIIETYDNSESYSTLNIGSFDFTSNNDN